MTQFTTAKYQLNIKIISKDDKVNDFYQKFTTHHLGDSGIDLYNFNEVVIDFLQVGTIDFEIQCEMIELETNTYASYYLVPRSSLSNTSFQLANSVGIIDAGYRGNLKAKVRNFSNVNFQKGSYFQIIAPDLKPIQVKIVDELSKTTRNNGGFGSTNS